MESYPLWVVVKPDGTACVTTVGTTRHDAASRALYTTTWKDCHKRGYRVRRCRIELEPEGETHGKA